MLTKDERDCSCALSLSQTLSLLSPQLYACQDTHLWLTKKCSAWQFQTSETNGRDLKSFSVTIFDSSVFGMSIVNFDTVAID